MVMPALNIAVASARQKTWRVKKRTPALGDARMTSPGSDPAENEPGGQAKGINPDEPTDRPGTGGRAGVYGSAVRPSAADAAQPADQATAAGGRHEVARGGA